MSVVLHVKSYCIPDAKIDATLEQFGKSVVDLIGDEWKNTLTSMRDIILKAIKQRIPNADAYKAIMINVALPKLEQVFNPDYPKYKKIINKFKAKQLGAYTDYISGVENAYVEGGVFEKRVAQRESAFETRVKAVLKVVGARPLGFGPAPKIMGWISGDVRVKGLRDTELDTIWDGEPTNVFDPALPYAVRQTVIPTIVEGIYYAMLYHQANDAVSRDSWLSDASNVFKNLLSKLIDSSKYTVATAVLGYDASVDNFYVEVQINTVA